MHQTLGGFDIQTLGFQIWVSYTEMRLLWNMYQLKWNQEYEFDVILKFDPLSMVLY